MCSVNVLIRSIHNVDGMIDVHVSGIPDCQSLGVQLLNVGRHRQTLVQGDLPLAPKASLVWLGYVEFSLNSHFLEVL